MTEQEIIQIVQTWLNNNFQKTKVSQLTTATSLTGLYVLGFLANGSVKAPIELLKGNAGKSVELRNNNGELQWRVEGGTWAKLYNQDDLRGKPFAYEDFTQEQLDLLAESVGDGLEFRSNGVYIQYRLKGGTWMNVVALADLKGDKGDPFVYSDFTQEQLDGLKVKGDKGDPNVLKIGSVEKSDEAKATITGGSPDQTLNLWLPKGDKGDGVELRKHDEYVQWRVVGDAEWIDLIALADLKGEKGDGVELRKYDEYIQWRVVGGEWINLVPLSEIKGDKGDAGENAVMEIGDIVTVPSDSQADASVEYVGEDSEGRPIYKLNLWLPKGVDGEGAGDMLKNVYDPTGKSADVFGYVDNKVKTDVPVNAKFTDTTYENATTSVSGLMSNTDKSKLDGVEAGANKYVHPAGTNPHGTTKSDVGLGNVDNVKQIPFSEKGANNGVAELDSTGKVLSSQLPSYVDDVLEYATLANFPTTGETGKIYIAINTNLTYRWTGTAYTEISPSIALGETSATAYRGDRGKIAYDHSQVAHAPDNAQKNSDITKAEIEAKLTGAITTHTHNQYIESSKFQVVTSLPASPVSGTFYFVKE